MVAAIVAVATGLVPTGSLFGDQHASAAQGPAATRRHPGTAGLRSGQPSTSMPSVARPLPVVPPVRGSVRIPPITPPAPPTAQPSSPPTGHHSARPITVDNSGTGFSWSGPTGQNFQVSQQSASAMGGQFFTTMNYLPCAGFVQHNAATWTADIGAPGIWDVAVFVPVFHDLGMGVPYHVDTADGGTDVTVDQQDHQGQWVSLGRFRLAAGANSVTMTDLDSVSNCSTDATAKYLAADAVRWTPR